MPRAGIEPARPFRAKGFSCCYGFRHRTGRQRPRSVCSPDYSFTVDSSSLGVSCLVSAPSSIGRLGSRLPSALPVKASLNLRHSTSLFSERALKCLSPSCLPFHHQGFFGANIRISWEYRIKQTAPGEILSEGQVRIVVQTVDHYTRYRAFLRIVVLELDHYTH